MLWESHFVHLAIILVAFDSRDWRQKSLICSITRCNVLCTGVIMVNAQWRNIILTSLWKRKLDKYSVGRLTLGAYPSLKILSSWQFTFRSFHNLHWNAYDCFGWATYIGDICSQIASHIPDTLYILFLCRISILIVLVALLLGAFWGWISFSIF